MTHVLRIDPVIVLNMHEYANNYISIIKKHVQSETSGVVSYHTAFNSFRQFVSCFDPSWPTQSLSRTLYYNRVSDSRCGLNLLICLATQTRLTPLRHAVTLLLLLLAGKIDDSFHFGGLVPGDQFLPPSAHHTHHRMRIAPFFFFFSSPRAAFTRSTASGGTPRSSQPPLSWNPNLAE